MLLAEQVGRVLLWTWQDERVRCRRFALVHQRFSTNTFPDVGRWPIRSA